MTDHEINENQVLWWASISDIPQSYYRPDPHCQDGISLWSAHHQFKPLLDLYDAEWRKRGFRRSP